MSNYVLGMSTFDVFIKCLSLDLGSEGDEPVDRFQLYVFVFFFKDLAFC